MSVLLTVLKVVGAFNSYHCMTACSNYEVCDTIVWQYLLYNVHCISKNATYNNQFW